MNDQNQTGESSPDISEMSLSDMQSAISSLASDKLSDLGNALSGEPVSEEGNVEEEGEATADPADVQGNAEQGNPDDSEEVENDDDGMVPASEHQRLQSKLEKTQDWAKQKEGFIQQLKSKLGEARQERDSYQVRLAEVEEQLKNFINQNNVDKPIETAEAAEKLKEVRRARQNVDQNYQDQETKVQVQAALANQGIDPRTISKREMTQCLKDMGYSDMQCRYFEEKPMSIGADRFIALVQMAKMKQAIVGLYRQNQSLTKNNGELKKKSETAVDRIMKAQSSNSFPGKLSTKLSSGKGVRELPSEEKDIANLSTEQLQSLLAES